MSDGEKKKMTNPVGRSTAREALVYASANHGHCTVVIKGIRRPSSSTIAFRCLCGVTYVIGDNRFSEDALRNVPEDKAL